MRRLVLLILMVVMLMISMAPVVQGFGGFYCEQAAAAHWLSPGRDFMCLVEVALDQMDVSWTTGGWGWDK